MLALLGIVLSVGLVDSLNPSTVGPALYIASDHNAARRLLGFIAGVFVVSTVAGVVLVLGPGRALIARHPSPHTEHLIEIVAGGALVAVAVVLWLKRERVADRVRQQRPIRKTSFLAGATIMAIELPTALPYFAVIAAVTGSGRMPTTQVALILLFNLAFITPLLAILAIYLLAGKRGLDRLAGLRERLERHAALLVPALVLLIAVVLLAVGAHGLAVD